MRRTQCPECEASDFEVHCASPLCEWLTCSSCKVVWHYSRDRHFSPLKSTESR